MLSEPLIVLIFLMGRMDGMDGISRFFGVWVTASDLGVGGTGVLMNGLVSTGVVR